jgi:hypothetical protein
MALKGINDLATGLGWVYVVEPDGTTIVRSYPNTEESARAVRLHGVEGSSVALNRKALGKITVATITGVGSITSIKVGGTNDIMDPTATIAYTGATTPAALAALINTEINSYNKGVSLQ